MNSITNYPSCIKIPPTDSKLCRTVTTMCLQKFDIKETTTFNEELISLANQIFGEGNWNHSITNQTIDFVEAFMGKYACGCVTFVKIQLKDGTFHEDMGYCYTEENMKGLSIHYARIGSLTNAFKNVLSCFGKQLTNKIKNLSKKISDSNIHNTQKEDLHFSIQSIQIDTLEPCAQSTPLINNKNDEQKFKTENTSRPKSPNDQEKQTVTRSKSPIEPKGETIPGKATSDTKSQFQFPDINYQKDQDITHKIQDSNKEALIRLERKRKQMEKQAEYKRLMKEKEQQKLNENKKPNPKY